MKKASLVFLSFFLTVLLLGCEVPDEPETIELTQEDSGRFVSMGLDDEITVSLESRASQGYVWVNMLTEGSIIVQDGEPVTDCPENPKPGDSCIETFTFHAVQKGSGSIMLMCIRTWDETAIEAVNAFDANIFVHK